MNGHTEDRQMSNEIVNYNPQGVTLLEMRADSERFPRIKTMPREQAVSGMTRIVSQAFLYRGQAADPANVQFIATALVEELIQPLPGGDPGGCQEGGTQHRHVRDLRLLPVQGDHRFRQGRGTGEPGEGGQLSQDETDRIRHGDAPGCNRGIRKKSQIQIAQL